MKRGGGRGRAGQFRRSDPASCSWLPLFGWPGSPPSRGSGVAKNRGASRRGKPNQGKAMNENETQPEVVWVNGRWLLKSVVDRVNAEREEEKRAALAAMRPRPSGTGAKSILSDPARRAPGLRCVQAKSSQTPKWRSEEVAKPPADPAQSSVEAESGICEAKRNITRDIVWVGGRRLLEERFLRPNKALKLRRGETSARGLSG